MSDSQKVRLAEVLTQDRKYLDCPEPREYKKLSVKLYGKGVEIDAPVRGEELKMKRHQTAKPGQVIVSEIWAKKGAIGIVPSAGEGALCTSHFFLFDINAERLDAMWLRWIFKKGLLEAQLADAARGTTGYAAVRPSQFLSLEIPLPPLPEQQRIVARIDEASSAISMGMHLRKQADLDAEALMAASRRVCFSSLVAEAAPLHSLCLAIIDNLHSNPRYAESGIPCIRSSDVGYGKLDLSRASMTDEEEYRRRTARGEPATGDIVLVREGGGTGKCALVGHGERFSLGQRVMMLRPDLNRVDSKFLLHQFLSPTVQADQIEPMCKGSASPHLNIGALRQFAFKVPVRNEQQRIVAELDALQVEVDALKKTQAQTRAELDALLPAILDRAFAGAL